MTRVLTSAQRIAGLLKDDILDGNIAPGSALREAALAGRYDVARNTVREALRLLGGDGLVRHDVNRGVTVTKLDDRDIAELYGIRRVIESAGVAAAAHVPRDRIEPLEAIAERYMVDLAANDRRRLLAADHAFHQHIVSLADSPRLDAYYAQVLGELSLAMSLIYEALRESGREHFELYALMRRRRIPEATELLVAHLVTAQRDVTAINRLRPLAEPGATA